MLPAATAVPLLAAIPDNLASLASPASPERLARRLAVILASPARLEALPASLVLPAALLASSVTEDSPVSPEDSRAATEDSSEELPELTEALLASLVRWEGFRDNLDSREELQEERREVIPVSLVSREAMEASLVSRVLTEVSPVSPVSPELPAVTEASLSLPEAIPVSLSPALLEVTEQLPASRARQEAIQVSRDSRDSRELPEATEVSSPEDSREVTALSPVSREATEVSRERRDSREATEGSSREELREDFLRRAARRRRMRVEGRLLPRCSCSSGTRPTTSAFSLRA